MLKVFENFWVKIAALALAVLLWFHVATNKVYQYEVTLPLKAVDLPGKLVLSEPPPDSVRVLVSATGKKLLQSDWKRAGLKLSLSRNQPGRFRIELTSGNLSFVFGDKVELLDVISPREADIDCDRLLEKRVPIKSRVVILPGDGYAVSNSDSIAPAHATVTGPGTLVSLLASLETKEEVLEGVRDNITIRVPVKHPGIYGLKISPDTAIVTVNVTPIKTRIFSDIPVRLINAPSGSRVLFLPDKIEIRAGGAPDSIDALPPSRISVFADYALADSAGAIPLQFILPTDISLVYKSADSVRIIH